MFVKPHGPQLKTQELATALLAAWRTNLDIRQSFVDCHFEKKIGLMAVYKKTEKGMNELLAPSPRIDVRLVSVLILVDGERDSAEVNRLAKEVNLPVDALDILFQGGFIDKKFKDTTEPADAKNGPRPAPVVPEPGDAPTRLKRYNALYSYLVEETKALLGLRGFIYQLRIERATTLLEFKALIEPISKAVSKKHGFEIARNFMRESERLAVAAIAEREL